MGKKMTVNTAFYYTNSNLKSGMSDYGTITVNGRILPYMAVADNQGNPIDVAKDYRKAYTDTIADGKLLDWSYKPLIDYLHDRSSTELQDLIGKIAIQYKIINGLDAAIYYQYEWQNTNAYRDADEQSYYARNLVNLYTQYNAVAGTISRIIPSGGILQKSNGTILSHNGRMQFNFNRYWGIHHLSAMLGGEIRQTSNDVNSNLMYGYYPDPLGYSYVDYITRYPIITSGSYSNIPSPAAPIKTNNRFLSAYMNAAYEIKSQYILTGSIRRDGANIFGQSTNDRWRPLWSFGPGWVISKEKFFHSNLFSILKLAVTWGASGNVDLTRTALPVGYTSLNTTTGLTYLRINQINNPSLKWETVKQTNYRVEAAFKQGTHAILEYYTKKGSDLYGQTTYDYTAWGYLNVITRNVASMSAKGVDLQLNIPIISNEFTWFSNLLLNYNSSKTTAYYSSDANNLSSALGGGEIITPIVGRPLYSVVAYRWGGLDQLGAPQGYIDGQLSTDYKSIQQNGLLNQEKGNSLKFMGNASPAVFGSLRQDLTWKNWGASINITYKFNYVFFKPALNYYMIANGYSLGTKDYENRWQNPGDESKTSIPAFSYPFDTYRENFFRNQK